MSAASRPVAESALDWARTLAQRGIDLSLAETRSTIAPPEPSRDDIAQSALSSLSRESFERFTEGPVLGEGGMGIVRLATQHALHREVAIKTLKADAGPASRLKLLREAWVTGRLEHPNIVPVYDLGSDAHGAPRIVLKRIAGSSWKDLHQDADAVRERFGEADLVEWNLRVFQEVARAVHFAHERGILHRDLKPENVMLGAHGEVYLVDWGLALALEDDGTGRLPLARQATELAGTPAYMAPEQWSGQGGLDVCTDVYLLGATLHEALAGAPPHEGTNLAELAASTMDPPRLGPPVHDELAAIVRRALSPAPVDRFESADAMRRAVATYLRHRASIRLASEATESLRALEDSLGRRADRVEVYERFGAVRFGFLQALREWPENAAARVGLERAVHRMVDLSLTSGDPLGAEALLAEIADPALAARVRQQADRLRAEQARLLQVAERGDPGSGAQARTRLVVALTGLWMIIPLGRVALLGTGPMSYFEIFSSTVAFALVAGTAMLMHRAALAKTLVNRTLVRTIIGILVGQILFALAGWIAGLSPAIVGVQLFGLLAVATWIGGAGVDRRLYVPAVMYALAYLVLSAVPSIRPWMSVLGHAVLFATSIRVLGTLENAEAT